MKRIACGIAFLATLSAVNAVAQTRAPALTDSARLQGAWTMVSGAADGVPLPASYVSGMKRVLAGNNLVVTMSGQLFFSAAITLDPAKSPRTIDYQMTGGFTAGAVQRGIYAFAGDTVRFCFGAPNAARPTDFKSAAGDGRTLSSWVRARGD